MAEKSFWEIQRVGISHIYSSNMSRDQRVSWEAFQVVESDVHSSRETPQIDSGQHRHNTETDNCVCIDLRDESATWQDGSPRHCANPATMLPLHLLATRLFEDKIMEVIVY